MSNNYGVLAAALKRRRGSGVDLDGALKDEEPKAKKREQESVDADGADGMSPGKISPVTVQASVNPAAEEQYEDSQSPVGSDSPPPKKGGQIRALDPDGSDEIIDEDVYDKMVDHKRLDYLESNNIDNPKSLWDKVQMGAKRKLKRGKR